MKQRTKISKACSFLLYGLAFAVLLLFLQKNHSAYALHLQDVKNSAGPPLAVGASVPSFAVETLDGRRLSSRDLPEKYVLVLASTRCPYAKAALESLEQEGQYRGITDIYGVYLAGLSSEEAEEAAALGSQWKNVTTAFDLENSVKWGFRCSSFPTILIVERGKLTARQTGWQGEATE